MARKLLEDAEICEKGLQAVADEAFLAAQIEEREVPLVSFTWKLEGPLGLKMMIRGKDAGDEKGVQVSGFAEAFPEDPSLSGIEKGMTVLAVNGQDVEHGSYNRVISTIQAAARPLRVEFGAPTPLVNGLNSKVVTLARHNRHETGSVLEEEDRIAGALDVLETVWGHGDSSQEDDDARLLRLESLVSEQSEAMVSLTETLRQGGMNEALLEEQLTQAAAKAQELGAQFRETLRQAHQLEIQCEAGCSPEREQGTAPVSPELLGLEQDCEEHALRALDELLQKQEHQLYSYKQMFASARAVYLSTPTRAPR